MPEYVTKVIENLQFSNGLFKSLIEKLLIYHEEKELNDFWLKKKDFEYLKNLFFWKRNHFYWKLFLWS